MKHFPASWARGLGLAALALLVVPPICRGADAAPPPEGAPATPPPAPPPMAGGMLAVEIQGAKIGTSAEEILKLAGKRPAVLQILWYETPVHDPKLVPFLLDKYEVTNAQYHRFLEDTGRITTFKTGSAALANLEEVAKYFAYEGRETDASRDDKWSWGQVYELNKEALHKSMPDLLVDPKDKSRRLGDKEAKQAFRLAALAPDVELKVYRWRLPRTWFQTSGKLEGNGAPDHPVRDVSYLEAEAFAEWAGKHVMTEAEYEWAARGPEGRLYPWGNDWVESIDEATGKRVVERRCNWGDLNVVDAEYQPTTVAVTAMPEGQSWCGAFHLLGNVAEWTSSWFAPYPGWTASSDAKNPWADYYPDFVRVIRGGSCADKERVALRCAYRNFVGVERMKPPKPQHSFEFVGFRCAYYLTPGLDRLEPAIARVLRPKKVRAEDFDRERFRGTVAEHFTPPGTVVADHVYVTGRASAVLLVPVKQLFPSDRKAPARSRDDLLNLDPETHEAVMRETVVLALLHTDVPLKVKVIDPKSVVPEPAGTTRRERRKAAAEPVVIEGMAAPDTYLLGLARGKVGLYRSNLDFVAFLDVPPRDVAARKLRKDEAAPPSELSVDGDVDLVKGSFFVRFGGKGVPAEEGVRIRFAVPTEAGVLANAAPWR